MAEHRPDQPKRIFTLLGGEVKVWIEQEAIHLLAVEPGSGDPVELSLDMAKELSVEIMKMVSDIEAG